MTTERRVDRQGDGGAFITWYVFVVLILLCGGLYLAAARALGIGWVLMAIAFVMIFLISWTG